MHHIDFLTSLKVSRANREYRRRKRAYLEMIAQRLREVRGTSEWWFLVNEIKSRRCRIGSCISSSKYFEG